MAQPFKLVSSTPQKTTTQKVSGAYRPANTGQRIYFVGSLVDGAKHFEPSFTVLAGEGGPTPTGGFAKWNIIDRPQRVGMTVLGGYDPMSMDVPVMFDAVVNKAQDVEADIQKLEWMAGRGILYSQDNGVGSPGRGDSPLVRVYTSGADGSPTALVPTQYQTDDLRWVVTSLAWDTAPLRDSDGNRIRQKVTVSLTQHVSGPGTSADSAAARQKARQATEGQFKSFPVTSQYNTIRKITTFCAHNQSHAAALKVVDANRSNPKLKLSRSVNQDLTKHLPLGTKIKVPLSVILG